MKNKYIDLIEQTFEFPQDEFMVEDNELNLKLFCDLLMLKGHEVIVSKDGLDIVNIAIEQLPELVLMDIQLADISGIDLIKALKNNPQTRRIPIIVITAFAMKNEVISKYF